MNEMPPNDSGEYSRAVYAPFPVDPFANEKRGIARAGLLAACALTLLILMQELASAVLRALLPYIGVYSEAIEGYTLDPTSTAYFAFCLAEYFFIFSLPILLLLLTNRERAKQMVRPAETKKGLLLSVLLLFPVLLGMTYAMGSVSGVLLNVFSAFGLNEPELFANDPTTTAGWICYALLLCVAAPLCEELLFRGALLTLLRPYGAGFAVACQAILFSVFHRTVAQMPYTVVGGLLFGYLAVRYGGILPSLLLHALNNGFSLVIVPLSDLVGDGMEEQLLFTAVIYVVMIAGGILIVGLWSKKKRDLFALPRGSTADKMPGATAFRTFFAQPAVIVYLLLSAYALIAGMVV